MCWGLSGHHLAEGKGFIRGLTDPHAIFVVDEPPLISDNLLEQ
jgi:hypothetical protein